MNTRIDKTSDLSVARALTWRYVIALALVASLSTAAWLSLHLVISEQKSTAAVVNLSGRQRMLSQRTALFSNLLANTSSKAERAAIHDKLKDTIELMERSHHGLTHGDSTMGLPDTLSTTVRAMYFNAPDGLDKQVEAYINAVQTLLQLPDDAVTPDNALLQYITHTASTTLVSSLDQMVRQYQLEGEASVKRLQNAETIFWGVTLLLLILEAALIFHPFVRHIKNIIGKLRHATEELKLHEAQLEETVRERTSELANRTKALADSEEKFRLISTAAYDAIVIAGTEGQVMYWNPAAEKIFGHAASQAMGQNLYSLLAPRRHSHETTGFERFQHDGADSFAGKTFETTALHGNGKEFPIELSISAVHMKNSWHALGIIRDITERKQMEEKVYQLAFYDVLTGLPNRRLFSDRLNQAIAASHRSGCYGSLMFLDLDNFKPLNDMHGHGAGDLLLIEAAKRLESCVRETDTVARIGGDEFVVMLRELSTVKSESALQAKVVAEKILTALSEPYTLTIHQEENPDIAIKHLCTASIGVTLFLSHEETPDKIMKSADTAMYQAKEAGRNSIRVYESVS